jgi:hypothetical protein
MIERTEASIWKPQRLAADTADGSGANLNWVIKTTASRRELCGNLVMRFD